MSEAITSGGGAYILDVDNASTLINLESINGFISYWDDIMTMACEIPNLKSLTFYHMYYNDSDSIEKYADKLSKIGLTSLNINGWNAVKNTNPISYEKLKGISKITSLQNLSLYNFGNLKDFRFLNSLTNLETLNLSNNNLNSLSFLKNLPKLKSLIINNNTSLNLNGFDELGGRVNNLDLLKESFSKDLREVDISSTGITNEEIISSDIKNLQWTSFLP